MAQVGTAETVPYVSMANRFSMTIPGDWTVLPLDPRTRDRRIAGLVAKEFGKADKDAVVRRQKVIQLRKAAADAHKNGAFFAAMHGRLIGEVALAASVIVSMLPPLRGPDSEVLPDARSIAAVMGNGTDQGEVLEHSVVDLVVGQAARIRRRGGSGLHGQDGREVPGDNLHFYVPLPETNRTLGMVFSTPLLPIADAYAQLFDLMAATSRWVQSDPAKLPPTDEVADIGAQPDARVEEPSA